MHPTTRAPERVEENVMPFGSVWIDTNHRVLVISGFVNQVEGAIELLACGPRGKTHESLLVLLAKPADIQAGLLLLGLQHGPPMPGLGQGPPVGDRVRLDVEWEQDGRRIAMPAETLIYDHKTKRVVKHGAWIFNGSILQEGRLAAMEEESLIASYWDPWAIINLQSSAGEDDERLSVNRAVVPTIRTPIRLRISKEIQ